MLIFLIFLVLLSIVLSIPSMQVQAARWGAAWLEDSYGVDLSLRKFAYTFPNRIAFEDLLLRDDRQDTLIFVGELEGRLLGYDPGRNRLLLQNAEVEGLRFYWLTYPGQAKSNFEHFVARLRPSEPAANASPFGMDIGQIRIQESRFRMEDLNCDSCYRMDYQKLHLRAQDFELRGTGVAAHFEQAHWEDRYGLRVKELRGALYYSDTALGAEDLVLQTAGSYLEGDFALAYPGPEAFSDFAGAVHLQAQWAESRLRLKELEAYAPALPALGTVGFSGSMTGKLKRLKTEQLRLKLASQTKLEGDFTFRNLTQPDSLWLKTKRFSLRTSPADMRRVASRFDTLKWPAGWSAMGATRLSGAFEGYRHDFEAEVALKSELIQAQAQAHLARQGPLQKLHYSGKLTWQKLKLGALLAQPELGNSRGELQIEGQGTALKAMKTRLDGELREVSYRGYAYQEASLHGLLDRGLFKGNFEVKDPHLAFRFSGEAGFRGDTGRYDFEAELEKAHLHRLHWSDDTLTRLSAKLDMDFEAVDFQRWRGQIWLEDLDFRQGGRRYTAQKTVLRADGMGRFKFLDLQSPLVEARLTGNFTPRGLQKVAQYYRQRYAQGARAEGMRPPVQQARLSLRLQQTQALTAMLAPRWAAEPGAQLRASYDTAQGLEVAAEFPALRYGDLLLRAGKVRYEGDYEQARISATAGRLKLAGERHLDSLRWTARQRQGELDYRLAAVVRDSIDAYLRHQGRISRQGGRRFDFRLDTTRFNVGKQDFRVAPGAHLVVDRGRFYVRSFLLRRGTDKVYLSGAISKSPYEVLRVQFEHLDIQPFNYFLAGRGTRLQGEMNGVLIGNQLLSRPRFLADVAVDSLRLNEDLLGTLRFSSSYRPRGDSLGVAATLQLGKRETMRLKGQLEPVSGGALRADLWLNRFRVAALNPLVQGVAENLRGMVGGKLRLRGTTTEPLLLGKLRLPKVAFTVSFLQTDYNLAGDPVVYFEKDKIRFPDLALRDTRFATEGTLDGEIRHQSFRQFDLDLRIAGEELLVLNTPPTREDAYYGTAFAGGEILLQGSPEDLHVDASVSTQRKTQFSIPVVGGDEERRSDFVSFYNPQKEKDSLVLRTGEAYQEEGVSLDFDIQVNQNATIAIILDEETGNQMTASGSGPIKLKMDALGRMELFGNYTVAKGSYNFNLEGLLNKKFDLMPGGTVSWSGDPYQAQLNLTARYVTKADPGVFLGNMVSTSPTRTEVFLEVQGPLTNPKIGFEIALPRANSTVQAVLNNRLSNEEAINQQVFSLLALNSFTPASNVFAGSGGGLNQWDLLANQAAAFLNRFTGDYQLSLSYQENQDVTTPSDQELEVGLSKDFFNERLTVNSRVGVPLNQQGGNASIAGDFEVEYSLTQDGRLRARAFNRAVDNSFGLSLGQQQIYQQGIGLRYRVDFDHFDKLWQTIRWGKGKQEKKPSLPRQKD